MQISGAAGQTKKDAGGKTASPPANLVRKDLLVPRSGELPLPKRNIFSPAETVQPRILPPPEVHSVPPSEANPKAEDVVPSEPSITALNLTYIGFVRAAKKMIALIVLEGQPMALNEGEMVRPGCKLIKITPREIEISLPDSKTQKFSFQGGKGED
jgi:hypothetical protein